MKTQVYFKEKVERERMVKTLRIYVYDVRPGMANDPRRVKFSKELFGYSYKWRKGKDKRTVMKYKSGLIDLDGCERAGDSAILVPDEHVEEFNSLFRKYNDVIRCRVFVVEREEVIY
ncbi:MAG: hypothetical protein ACTSXC_02305 [Candidatus Freyarchaeota archaeon]